MEKRAGPAAVPAIFANLLFGANFSFYVSLTRNYLDFQQIFMLQVLAASIFFIPFALFSKQSYRIPANDQRRAIYSQRNE